MIFSPWGAGHQLALFDGPAPSSLQLEDADLLVRLPSGLSLPVGEAADYDGDGELDLPVGLRVDGLMEHGWLWLVPAEAGGELDEEELPRRLQGPTKQDHLGSLPQRAGDVDGDGAPDLLVGLMGSRRDRGAAALLAGPLDCSDWPRRLAEPMARTWFWSDRQTDHRRLGRGVSWLDLDGDGLDDVALGAQDTVLIFAAPAAGRLEARSAEFRIEGFGLGDWVQELPDIDGDGLPELVSGSEEPSIWGTDSGYTWIFASGLLRP